MNSENELLDYLVKDGGWVSSSLLASNLNVSIRTLRTLVQNINKNTSSKIILSSNKGYKVSVSEYAIVKNVIKDNENYLNINREQIILKELLISKNGVDIFEMADELCVSEQTIISDVFKIKNGISSSGVNIYKENDRFYLKGAEIDIRRLFVNTVYKEVQKEMMSINSISKYFPELDLNYIKNIVLHEIHQYDLIVINDYKMIEIILHISVLLDRKNREIKKSSENMYQLKNDDAQYNCSIHIIRNIFSKYQVCFDSEDINVVYSLLMISTKNKNEVKNSNRIENILDSEKVKFVKQLVNKVYNEFSIDLNNEDFIESFSLHLNSLVSNKNRNIRNPLSKEIKNDYPIIYEISVFIANAIKDKYPDVIINEDETSYISLHVGAQVENQTTKKLQIVIVNPKYLNLNTIIETKILSNFSNEVNIVSLVSNVDDLDKVLEENEVDLIISTYKIKKEVYCPIANVSIFINNDDLIKIYSSIREAKEFKSKKGKLSILNYFDGSFVNFKDNSLSRYDIIGKLCNLHHDYDKSFYNRVVIRETMASTEYKNMAITHPIECNEKETFISVGVFDKPYKWNNNLIDIVFLLSIKREDRANFLKILSSIIKVFSSKEWNEESKKIDNFEKFKEFLKNSYVINDVEKKEGIV